MMQDTISTEKVSTDLIKLNSDLAAANVKINKLQAKIDAISNLFTISYNSDGSINTESYTAHTHSYKDKTIEDTADGSGATTDTSRTTGGVS